MTTENLWGEIPDVSSVRAPVTILREQASVLTGMTGGLLEGHVAIDNRGDQTTYLTLSIVARTLNSYRIAIAGVEHALTLYPAAVRNLLTAGTRRVRDEQEFKLALKEVLSSEAVRRVLTALLVQLKAQV